jgi:hypothetical protein
MFEPIFRRTMHTTFPAHSILLDLTIFHAIDRMVPVAGATRSKPQVCELALAGIVGSNPAGGMGVCLLSVLCVVRYRSLGLAAHSSRGVLPSVVCLIACDHETSTMMRSTPQEKIR